MVRSAVVGLLRLVVRIFFRRVEVAGLERVPASAPVIFAINHPNGLIDPLLIVAFAPRPVSLLGKAPLLRMPLIGAIARALDTIPVYRRQDGAAGGENRTTFLQAREVLERGGAIAIAPEGTSHSDPKLKPFKTGAARIALGAGTADPVVVVPVGLFYTAKAVFRSSALVAFGPPVTVPSGAPLGPDGEPSPDQVLAVTESIGRALAEVVVQADEREAVELAEAVERLTTAAEIHGGNRPMADRLAARQRILRGYHRLRTEAPERVDQLRRRVEQFTATLAAAGLEPGDLRREGYHPLAVAHGTVTFALRSLLALPLAVPGLLIHYPAYWLIGRLARRVVGDQDDVLSTAKVIGAALLFPLTWGLVAGIAGRWAGWPIGLLVLGAGPLAGYAALRFTERFDRFLALARAVGLRYAGPRAFARLATTADQIRADLFQLADDYGL